MNEATQQIRATYESIASAYEARQVQFERGWGADLRDQFAASLPGNSLVADIGCGPGIDAAAIAALGHRVIGFDFTHAMLQRAMTRHPLVVQCDMRQLPLAPNSLDAIWSSYALLHIPIADLGATLRGFVRVLKPGARVCLLFASGAEPLTGEHATVLETVDYKPELARTYVYTSPERAYVLMTQAGFSVDELDAEPNASRGAFWVKATTAK